MRKKIDYKNTFFQVGVGLLVYFLFLRNEIKPIKKEPILIVGDLEGDGAEYSAIYFKDTEYFKNFPIPSQYVKNWNKLKRVLDAIRIRFGSAVLISRGYSPTLTGLITDSFQTCQSVEIRAQNGDNKTLSTLINSMQKSGEVVLTEIIFDGKTKIKMTING